LSPFFSSSLTEFTDSFSPNRLGDIKDLDKKIFDIYSDIMNEIGIVSLSHTAFLNTETFDNLKLW
jgi:hypothetical protein